MPEMQLRSFVGQRPPARPTCRLTNRSTGPTAAYRLAREASSLILRLAGQAPCRAGPVSSNVRRRPLSRSLALTMQVLPRMSPPASVPCCSWSRSLPAVRRQGTQRRVCQSLAVGVPGIASHSTSGHRLLCLPAGSAPMPASAYQDRASVRAAPNLAVNATANGWPAVPRPGHLGYLPSRVTPGQPSA